MKWKIQWADTHTPAMDMNRKTNVHLHCMLSRSVLFLFCQILLHFIPFAGSAFISHISTQRFFLFRMWEHMWNPIRRMLFRRVFHLSLLFHFDVSATFKFPIACTQPPPIHLYKNLHCFNIFPADYDAIGQTSGTAHTRIDQIEIGWFCRLSILFCIIYDRLSVFSHLEGTKIEFDGQRASQSEYIVSFHFIHPSQTRTHANRRKQLHLNSILW